MKILSISAQKPDSTGSGIYLTELVKAFSKKGHEQAVMAGIGPEDQVELPSGVSFYPVRFETDALPFPVAGMSDEMPYKSTRYQDLTPEMVRQFQESFLGTLDRILAEFDPDVILCHHLYLLTAFVRRHCPDRKIYGFCHNTDLRQMEKTDLERAFIAEEIRKLDGIFTLQEAQTERIRQIYHVDRSRIQVVGIGYNDKIFTQKQFVRTDERVTMVYAGKIAEETGVKSLIRALGKLCLEKDPSAAQNVRVFLAGGAGNQTEYEEIRRMEEIAGKIGLAFQIQDDILDVTGTEEILGKPVHSDEKNEKTTYVSWKGLEGSRREAARLTDEAIADLRALGRDRYKPAAKPSNVIILTTIMRRKVSCSILPMAQTR